jgi:hypothetical protein
MGANKKQKKSKETFLRKVLSFRIRITHSNYNFGNYKVRKTKISMVYALKCGHFAELKLPQNGHTIPTYVKCEWCEFNEEPQIDI